MGDITSHVYARIIRIFASVWALLLMFFGRTCRVLLLFSGLRMKTRQFEYLKCMLGHLAVGRLQFNRLPGSFATHKRATVEQFGNENAHIMIWCLKIMNHDVVVLHSLRRFPLEYRPVPLALFKDALRAFAPVGCGASDEYFGHGKDIENKYRKGNTGR